MHLETQATDITRGLTKQQKNTFVYYGAQFNILLKV